MAADRQKTSETELTTLQVSAPTTSQESQASLPATYTKGEPLTAAMLTPKAIAAMTAEYKTPQDTVAVWAGKAYVPTLNKCVTELGRGRVEAALKLYLVQLNMTTNSSRPLTEGVIDAMVPIILDHIIEDLNTSVTTADLKIVFARAMRGHYGKMYGGFGCQNVCSWFSQYDVEKMEAIDRYEEKKKQGDLGGRRMATDDAAKFHDVYAKYLSSKK